MENNNKLKVLYLFSGKRKELAEMSKKGEHPDDHMFGMFRLNHYGVEGGYLELEDHFSPKIAMFLRNTLKVYFSHLPLFFKFFKFDVIFSSTAYGTELVHALLHIRQPKFVIYDFSVMGLIGERKTLKEKLFYWMVSRAAGIITISQDEADRLKVIFPKLKDNIIFVPFGVDVDFFKLENIQELNQILTVGFDPGRDYKTLFEATKSLGINVVATRSRRIGSLRDLPAHVRVDHFSWQDLVKEYAQSKIVVLPLDISSRVNEAMGCSTLVQAMACGKAIIVTRTPTTESYITNGVNGILVEPKDEMALENAIRDLLGNKNKRHELGRKAREFAEKNCGAELAAKKMADFFKKVAA